MSDQSQPIDIETNQSIGSDDNPVHESLRSAEVARINDGGTDLSQVKEGQSSLQTLDEDIEDDSSMEKVHEESSDSEFNPSEGEFDDDHSVDSAVGDQNENPSQLPLQIQKNESKLKEEEFIERMDVEDEIEQKEVRTADLESGEITEEKLPSTGQTRPHIDISHQTTSLVGKWANRSQKTRKVCRHFSYDLLERAVRSQWEPEMICDLLYMISKELNFDYALMRNVIQKTRIGTPRLLVSLIDRDPEFFFSCQEICALLLTTAADVTHFIQLLDEALSLELINLEEEHVITTVCLFLQESLTSEDLKAYATVLCEYCPSTEYCGRVLEQITSKLEVQAAAEVIVDVITLDFFPEISGTMKECLAQLTRAKEQVEAILDDEGYERKSESGDIIESDEDSEGNLRGFVVPDELLLEEIEAVAKEEDDAEPLLSPLPSEDDEDDETDYILEEASDDSNSYKNDDSEGSDADQGGTFEKRVFLRFKEKEAIKKENNEGKQDQQYYDGSDEEEMMMVGDEIIEKESNDEDSLEEGEERTNQPDTSLQLSKIERKRLKNEKRKERRQKRAQRIREEKGNDNLSNQKRQRDSLDKSHLSAEDRARKRQKFGLEGQLLPKGDEVDHYLEGLESSMVVKYEEDGTEIQREVHGSDEGIKVETNRTEEEKKLSSIDEEKELSIFEI